MSLISNVPSGQHRKHAVRTQTLILYMDDYYEMFSHLGGLQDFKYFINIFGYPVVHLVGCSVSEYGQ